jgi:hypothetical protein
MNIVTAIKAAYEPSPFERLWRRMTDSEKRSLVHAYYAPGADADQILQEDPTIIEMALATEGYRCRDYVGGDYERVGSKQSTDWGM